MSQFKPTHRLCSGHLAELEHTFTLRQTGRVCGLFFLELGGASIYQMDSVTELPKVIQVSAHEEPEPLRVAPQDGMEVWIVEPGTPDGVVSWLFAAKGATSLTLLARGELWATKNEALAAFAARQAAKGITS